MVGNFRNVGLSFLVHGMVLGALFTMRYTLPSPPEMVLVTSQINELEAEKEFTDLLDNGEVNTQTVSLSANTSGQLGSAGAARIAENMQAARSAEVVRNVMFNQDLQRPLFAGADKNFNLDSPNIGGVGTVVGSAGGDAGSVDRITLEIRRALEKNRVLVCWVLDSSASMRERREKVVQRLDAIYNELSRLGVDREKALLSGIISFGNKNQFLTKEPTADTKQLVQLVKAMKDDDTGTENVFTAVKEACLKYRTYQTNGRRQLMIIVLTDERGDDPYALDDAVATCQRQKVPVYVIGPMAPFGRDKMYVDWTDKPTGEVFKVAVDRGPESIEMEHLSLPFWGGGDQYDLFGSGFGPYALTRLVRETNGLYFVDDSDFKGIRFNPDDMREYRPDYVPVAQYLKMRNEKPLRVAVIEAAKNSQGAQGEPPYTFPVDGMNPRLTEGQRVVAKTESFVARALVSLQEVEKLRLKETSKRWQAHYDLMMGRLLAAKVRCGEYNWALAQMKVNPKTPKETGRNAWRLVGDKEIGFGRKEVADTKKAETNVRKSDPKATAKAKEDADHALKYLERVVKEHGGTPWGQMAERELMTPLGFKWVEAYVPPPPKPGQPPTAAQKADMERAARRADAMKRVPKF